MALDDTVRVQIAENMRFYADMRFKQLTLLLAWLTLAGGGIAQYGEKLLFDGLTVRQVLAVSALLFTSVFWLMEIKASLYWRAHRDACRDLWPRPKDDCWNWLNATNVLFILHAIIFGFWYWCSWKWQSGISMVSIIILVLLGIFGGLVFIFGIHSYYKHRLQDVSNE